MDPASLRHHDKRKSSGSGTGTITEVDQDVFDALPLGLVVLDRDGRRMRHNSAASFLVAGCEDVIEALASGSCERGRADWSHLLADVLRTGVPQCVEQVVWQDAERREYLLNLQWLPMTDATHAIVGATLVIEDVTVTAGMEKRLAVSERMAAVGKLAARVAHELNNPLDGILRYLNLAIRASQAGTTDRLDVYLHRSRDGLKRMADILRELVDFSRGSRTSFDAANINSIIEDAVKVMGDQAAESNVSVICTFDSDMPTFPGTNLFQVFCNLIKNAIDAMPEGGVLTITTRRRVREVIIRFEDTGEGLPENVEQIFEPFFTTKPPGKGTGLGLAITKDIVEKFGGRITAQPASPRGTVFDVRIPLEWGADGLPGAARPTEETNP